MSVHAMSPIREEEVESTMSANACTPNPEADANVNANMTANTATPISEKEEVKTSSSASTMIPVREKDKEELNSGTIAIGYVSQVPSVKWHPTLEMMSKAGMSQGQYERKVLAQGFPMPEEVDEFISIDCPDMPMGVSRTFNIQRSALMRSPTLTDFFMSLDYLPGCKMNLHFMNDPGVCFEIVQAYLENGPDCYPILRLKVYITRLTKNADRFLVLIRLHKFAIKLGLVHLRNMAFEVIHDLEWEMSAECCPKIAELVFAHQSPYDNNIKLWVLKHIGHFHKKLSRSNTWAALVPILDPELGEHWATMDASGVRVLSMIAEEATDEAVLDVLAGLSSPAKNSAVSDVKGPSTSSSPSKSEASTQTDESPLTEVPSKPESSTSHQPEVKKTDNVTPKGKKHKRSRVLVNKNQFIIGMHKEWVITCSPTKRSKMSPKSSKSAPPTVNKPEAEETNAKMSVTQPTITVSQYEEDISPETERNGLSAMEASDQDNEDLRKLHEQDNHEWEDLRKLHEQEDHEREDLRKLHEQDDHEWEDEEEEAAIQEAIRSFGAAPRDDSKARELLGLRERSASMDGPPRPQDKNAKARRVLGINDDGGGLIAGRRQTRMMRVKKSLTKFNDFLNT